MTTKKQRRAKVADKRATFDEETKRLGLEALEKSRADLARRRKEKDDLHEQIFGRVV